MADLASTRVDSWMSDVKLVRIPRPKFASSSGGSGNAAAANRRAGSRRYPAEPPTDYCMDSSPSALDRATEELRRAVQEKL